MTGAFVSRWPVLEEHRVTAGDLDAGGVVRDAAVARWVAAARSAYLDRCAALRRRQGPGLELQVRTATLPPGASLGRPAAVVVTAGVREVWRARSPWPCGCVRWTGTATRR
jgi:acyl-CoA thioesterase FadM